jgi:hypothetical protein
LIDINDVANRLKSVEGDSNWKEKFWERKSRLEKLIDILNKKSGVFKIE